MIIQDIVNQHAEESAFLWMLRNDGVNYPHFDLRDLSELDRRVEAHIDGLRTAGESGREICRAAMGVGEPGEIFTAGLLAFETAILRTAVCRSWGSGLHI